MWALYIDEHEHVIRKVIYMSEYGCTLLVENDTLLIDWDKIIEISNKEQNIINKYSEYLV